MIPNAIKASLADLGKHVQTNHGDNTRFNEHKRAHVDDVMRINQGLDTVQEDLTRNRKSRETGYFGQASEVQWLHTVRRQMQHIEAEPRTATYELRSSGLDAESAQLDTICDRTGHARQGASLGSQRYITDISFYLDSSDNAADVFTDPYEIPDVETAEQLFGCYINAVHSFFPLVRVTIHPLYEQRYTDFTPYYLGTYKLRESVPQICCICPTGSSF
jgi:hypothetical protein